MKKEKFAIIDANAVIHRAFHALPPLMTKEGVLVNAVYGFANILFKVLKDIKPDYIAVCFDVAKKTFRNEIYKDYKAHREKGPDELHHQFALVRELIEAFNMKVYGKKGYEADDLIGTIAEKIRNPKSNPPESLPARRGYATSVAGGQERSKSLRAGTRKNIKNSKNRKQKLESRNQRIGDKIETYIVTGDMDALQLVDENTKVYTLRKGLADTVIYNVEGVKEKYGFGPELVVDYKALRGDPSDNIPGVRGIGNKTATELIKKFGGVEEIYKYVDKIRNPKSDPPESLPARRGYATSVAGGRERSESLRAGIRKNIKNSKNRKQKLESRNQEEIKIKERIVNLLQEYKKDAMMSKRLATIDRGVDIDFDLEECKIRPFNAQRIVELFQEWNFKTLISRIPVAEKMITKGQASLFGNQRGQQGQKNVFEIRDGYELINNGDKFKGFIEELKKQKEFAIDTETDGLDPFADNLIGMSFSWKEGRGWYIPFNKSQITNSKSKINPKLQIPKFNFEELGNILADEKVKKIGHNIKFDLEVLERAGFELKGVEFDTMVASYLLNPGTRQHGLDALVFTEFGYEMTPITSLIGHSSSSLQKGSKKDKEQLDMSQVELARVADYAIEDVDYTWRLYRLLKKRLEQNDLSELMRKIETPLISVLARVEKNGILIDKKFLGKMSRELELRIMNYESRIYKMAGAEFNVRSPLQLKEILFNKMKISTAGLMRTKTGISTAASELEKLRGIHPIVDLIMEHRELSKLKSTYADALPELINKEDGRIHTSFNQTVTATGRLSSSNPNLQNIPIRTELGREIRKAFVAAKGKKLVAIDYSQIELRVAAHMSGDRKMIKAFQEGRDIHAITAAEVFEVPIEEVTSDMRRKAKEVNFGVIYGLGARGLAQRTRVSYDEALAFIEKYFEVYSGLQEYLEETIALAHEMEYVETLFGRKRYLPEINASHQGLRAQAERMAVNQPLQGTAADLIKMAMIEVNKLIEEKYKKDEVKMILQIHDELIFEIKENEVKKISGEMQDIMETVYKFKVPIVAEVGVGDNWGECK